MIEVQFLSSTLEVYSRVAFPTTNSVVNHPAMHISYNEYHLLFLFLGPTFRFLLKYIMMDAVWKVAITLPEVSFISRDSAKLNGSLMGMTP